MFQSFTSSKEYQAVFPRSHVFTYHLALSMPKQNWNLTQNIPRPNTKLGLKPQDLLIQLDLSQKKRQITTFTPLETLHLPPNINNTHLNSPRKNGKQFPSSVVASPTVGSLSTSPTPHSTWQKSSQSTQWPVVNNQGVRTVSTYLP